MIDENRKLVQVQAVIDTTHFRASWRGQIYEAKAVPDTSTLTVGDSVFCHVMPESTQLLALIPATGALWWTPGNRNADGVGELWRLVSATSTPVKVWECPNSGDYEAITQIFWCQIDSHLYLTTYAFEAGFTYHNRVYQVNTTTGACTLITSWNRPHLVGALVRNRVDPVIDCAEHGSYVYFWENGYNGGTGSPFSNLERFDPVAGTVTLVLNYLDDTGNSDGYFGGVAVDPVSGDLVVSDGWNAYRSPSGNPGSFVFDADLTIVDAPSNSYDNFPLQTFVGADDLVYGGMGNDSADPDSVVARRIAAGNWVPDLNPGNARANGFVSFCRSHTAGVGGALWAQRWAWFTGTDRAEIWTKPSGGAWAMDWAGPALADGYHAVSSQSLAYSWGKIWSLVYSDINLASRLYRRDAAGTYVLVQQFDDYYPMYTVTETLGICASPNGYLKAHEA